MESLRDIIREGPIREDTQDVVTLEGQFDVIRLRGGLRRYANRLRAYGQRRLDDAFKKGEEYAMGMAEGMIDQLANRGESYVRNTIRRLRGGRLRQAIKPNANETECPKAFQIVVPQKDSYKAKNVYNVVRQLNLHKVYQLMQYFHATAFPITDSVTTAAAETNWPANTSGYYYKNATKGYTTGLFSQHAHADNNVQGYNFGDVTNYFNKPTSNPVTGLNRILNPAGMVVNHNTLLFMASYPFESMMPNLYTSDVAKPENFRMFKTTEAAQTTDPSFPITYENIFGNLDWNRLAILGVKYTMEFVNYNPCDMVVEVLFYKYLVDLDQYDYVGEWEKAIWNQYQDYNAYCKGGLKVGASQIQIVQKDRFVMKGTLTYQQSHNSDQSTYLAASHCVDVRKRTYYCKKKWTYVRATDIKATAGTPTEETFSQTYIDRENMVWCRIAVWQKDGHVVTNAANFVSSDASALNFLGPARAQKVISQATSLLWSKTDGSVEWPTNVLSTSGVGRPMVDVQIWKRAYVQVDTDIYKTYAKA